ncbi:peptide ABC transporter substrate-binding protein [Streptomyces cinereoruber]|uniref:ABC transporter substrate-binding protein n=1 Tax=Streptomyces cinereoruber TaxID=67260 RepID=A0AAV4KCT4_9ACTN|nr:MULTISPECIES: ABC transporter substrate-binding protein [Streptomyces]AVH95658.1 ABC transporter substrate-binding protein [Streptomyces sp. WAC00288]KYG54332.1 peptide ABC transporter substrate-binding protein [Streptomyces sp. WAC04657]MBB4157390.1 oligopeptide transport system substrate-binding protein [Streptomyces cinereoruber]MBY8814797.1 ABC transporter substrate-binding protein [Streptomyces cinereoruber]NIH59512.1 oligopeptide transport system substrate-binding protein [Streptomyce
MRGAKSAKWVTGAIIVALAATACGGGKSDGGSDAKGAVDPNGIFSIELGEPEKPLYTGDTMESNGSAVMAGLFSTLVDYKADGSLEMINAESVTTTDSKTWTVKLKPGWTFHDGTPVTAKSYVDAWNWNANVKNAMGLNSWFADIKGFEKLSPEGEGAQPTSDKLDGLKVVDENTFTIELTKSVPYFGHKLAYIVFAPLPEAFYKDTKAAGQKPIGNGPYKFKSWDHKKQIEIVRYDDYKGPNKAKNGGVVFKNYTTLEAAYEDLKSGNVDVLRQLAPKDLPVYRDDLGDRAVDQAYSAIQTVAVAFYADQWKKPKPVDPKVIQGLSMAIDRATITKTVLQGTREPATGWVAKGVLGYQPNAVEVTKFDPAKAKELIKAGGGVPGNKISIQFNADGGHKEWVDAVCNSITQSTGVACVGDGKPDFQADLTARKTKQVKSFYRSGWVLDYPVNANFISDLFRTGAAGNQGDFSNKELDAKIAKADSAATLEESVKQYQAIEKDLVNYMPSIPLWYYKVNAGYSEKVSGVAYGQDGDPILTGVEVHK